MSTNVRCARRNGVVCSELALHISIYTAAVRRRARFFRSANAGCCQKRSSEVSLLTVTQTHSDILPRPSKDTQSVCHGGSRLAMCHDEGHNVMASRGEDGGAQHRHPHSTDASGFARLAPTRRDPAHSLTSHTQRHNKTHKYADTARGHAVCSRGARVATRS
jgi:hypothetical protein